MTLERRGLRERCTELLETLARSDNGPADKLLRVTQGTLASLGLRSHTSVSRRIIVELTRPPDVFRGLRDLLVRRGNERDLDPLSAIDDTDRSLVKRRLARGDFAYVGELEREIVCHTWFRRGPASFDEDRLECACWGLDERTFWSFNGAARRDARQSGVFVKLFQTALREVFELHGGRRVQGFIHHTNEASLSMHDRLGFQRIGTVVAVAVPGVKWIRWEHDRKTRHWLARRDGDLTIALPPT